MKQTSRTVYLILFTVLAVATSWWLSRPKQQPLPIAVNAKRFPSVLQATAPPTIQGDTPPEIVQPFAQKPYLGLKDPRWIERRRLREEDPAHQWRTPIEFFGKVVDEKNQPVAGAEIEYSWTGTIEKYGGDGVVHKTMTSDANGFFHIHGMEGKVLTVLASKEGYHRKKSWNGGSFDYAGFWEPIFIKPDRNKPVTFHLLKRPVAEPTFHVDFRSIPKPPLWETRIDFLAQPAEVSFGGDIILKLTRPPHPGYKNLFNWQLKIEGVSGAEIFMSEDEFMLRAPDKDYQKAIAKEYKQVRGNSIETVKFYVRNKARKLYAAVSVEVTPYYPNHATKEDAACFIVSGTVNPNDSPNLEYDPEKDIREMAK